MKFSSYYFLSLLFVGASTTFAADNTTPSSSLRGSTESSSSNISNDEPKLSSNNISNDEQQNEHRHLDTVEFTVGPTLSNGCYVDPPHEGDYCSKWNQQCIYPITGSTSNDGRMYYSDSYYSCNCVDENYYCDVRCPGSDPCYYTESPTFAPLTGRFGVTAPPLASFCPQSHPSHNSECQYPGMECDYLSHTGDYVVDNCVCENLKNNDGVWHRLWKCYGSGTGRNVVTNPSSPAHTGTNVHPHQPHCRAKGHGCESSSDCCDGLRCDIYVNICEENVSTGTNIVVVNGSDNHPYNSGSF